MQPKIGIVINPISGMGGEVGLKGTDGKEILDEARRLGAIPKIQKRAELFLSTLTSLFSKNIEIVTPPGIMGENACKIANTPFRCISDEVFRYPLELYATSNLDTQIAIKEFVQEKVDLIVFFGGDGTARDILEVLGQKTPCLGIPGGVKVYSSVFAADPVTGAELVVQFLKKRANLVDSEVVDINEQAFRNDSLQINLFGYMKTPHMPMLIQGMKLTSPRTDEEKDNQTAIARTIIEEMKTDKYYIFGPGTTVQTIFELLNEKKTLLGFDILFNKTTVARDVNEKQIYKIVSQNETELIISPIGRQGFVFGRGNLQITSEVMRKIKKEHIHIICSRSKLNSLPNGCIRTDIRDPKMDEQLRGFYRVLIDYNEYKMVKMV